MPSMGFGKLNFMAMLLTAGLVGGAAAADNEVLLGGPELTSGIPGSGALTIAEVRSWLSKPENHETLSVQLPMGLDKGAAGIVIPEDNPLTRAKIELGRQLYFDPRLSRDGTVSCASCHHPDKGYAFDTQFGVGVKGQEGGRNSPVSYNRILSGPQFWDGRAESLEAQAVGPIANPIEMGFTHDECVERLKTIEGYRLQFEEIFPDGGVTIDNVGKAIASFERVVVTGPSPADYYEPILLVESQFPELVKDLEAFEEEDPDSYDFYMEAVENSEKNPMSEAAIRGRKLFFDKRSNCSTCHTGANFSDEQYHNLGVGMDSEKPDLGRFDQTKEDKDRGAFKTPTIRNVALTAPYMHDGSQQTLEEVVEWYAKGGHANDHLSDKVKKLDLTDQEKSDLVAYMKALTGEFPDVCQDRLPKN